ncbi:MAG: hypothetical protein AAF800_13805, partial [Planctomycetota bacterium]
MIVDEGRQTVPADGAAAGRAVRRAWVLVQRGDYAAAAETLAGGDADDLNVRIPLYLSRNLAAMAQHRPEALDGLAAAGLFETLERSPLVPTASGRLVPAWRTPGGGAEPVTVNADPAAAADAAVDRLRRHLDAGEPVAFADPIDGYLVSAVAAARPTLPVGQQQPVYLVATEPHLLTACLMLHDWSASDGPIADPRFHWFVGPGAGRAFADLIHAEPMRVIPQVNLGRESYRAAMATLLDRCHAAVAKKMQRWSAEIDRHYTGFEPRALTVGLPTRPRALLITSRFTTVLKHSTADCAAAFAKLGWRTLTLIEPTDCHRTTEAAIRRAIATFKPDLVFAIDHLRGHCRTAIPAELPYLCWVQDQLPKLTSRAAGASVGPRDFVLTMVGPTYVGRWGYPARQIVEMPKLTRPPVRPESWDTDGDDLVYVSNASHRVEDLLDRLEDPTVHAIGRRIVEAYRRGDTLPTLADVGRVVDAECRRLGHRLSPDERALVVNRLTHPLNDTLYRQQALRWIAEAADDLGLSLALHGHGWEDHPEFARFARGPVAYGPDLEALTRRSRINLQIIPSFCLHQRLLDGLVAGGFFLVRHHPSDTAL